MSWPVPRRTEARRREVTVSEATHEEEFDYAAYDPKGEYAVEDFHDDFWTAPKLWALMITTLIVAFAVILWLANTLTRPM